MKEEILSTQNPVIQNIIKYQQVYLIILFTILFSTVATSNYMQQDPILQDPESYFHLTQNLWENPLHHITTFLSQSIPINFLIFIPYLLGLACIKLFYHIARKIELQEHFTFLFVLLVVLSPAFIYATSILSAYITYLAVLLAAVALILQKNTILKVSSIIPFYITTLFDGVSSLITITAIALYWIKNKSNRRTSFIILASTICGSIINVIIGQPLAIGPFHVQRPFADLISLLGGYGGVSFFTIILAIIGIAITWRKQKLLVGYFILPIIGIIYWINTHAAFYASLLISFFAAVALLKLFEREWELEAIKKVTFFVLLLGILFSTLSFVDRVQEQGPQTQLIDALVWVEEWSDKNTVIFSEPEIGYYIKFFGEREPLATFDSKEKIEVFRNMSSATYTTELFPLLEHHNISTIVITEKMKEEMPEGQQLLFLLRNERFKMRYQSNNTEVWTFEGE